MSKPPNNYGKCPLCHEINPYNSVRERSPNGRTQCGACNGWTYSRDWVTGTLTRLPFDTHRIKTWVEPFQAVWDGEKTYEIRRKDRDYKVGDELVLLEYDQKSGTIMTGEIYCTVMYMTPGGEWGVPHDMCVMGIMVHGKKRGQEVTRLDENDDGLGGDQGKAWSKE